MKKKIFITGSTDGIGKLAAFKLAAAGHEVILHGRNAQKLEAVLAELKTASPQATVSGYLADLSDLSSVSAMAGAVKADHSVIDVLINNAGILLTKSPRNSAGMDIRFLVNYLAPVLLTRELLPLLHASEQGQVINLSSAAQAPVSLTALQGGQALSDQEAYAQSKLALTMWNHQMARQEDNITFIAVNPGSLLNTKMVKEAYGRHWSPADKGADILVALATEEKHMAMSGKYFDNDRGGYGPAHADATDQTSIDELLKLTDQLLP
ncbi:SDR family NAD(P)-dependent oxidoreductase [Neolewinella agarilytica]|uniref:Short-chain dehydrogenase n=1 Tax=Neolewinella agarilytica TaxID=478744 RepID=A0A1H8ZSN4_9BACT|nr:SDR family NAD(P)-dependent oxidoreductase [Neolewinella agarilytica]SEP66748.1 Short-chain dehydrogenase [Neolewinella agarilytica]